MNIQKTAAVMVMSGLLMTASLSVWAAMPTDNMTPSGHAEIIAASNVPLFATVSSLEPSKALQTARQGHSNCKASRIYGTSDVVGDKSTCIMGGYSIPSAYGFGVAAGGR